jgi:dissimilatory sulfite reductase (desulfoviridin) alpha/beta subunit
MEAKTIIQMINGTKNWFFEKIKTNHKHLAKWIQRKREDLNQ